MTLRASGLRVSFGTVLAVREAELVLRPGELVGLTGPSGAGKTSLLTALAGVVTPTAGSALLDEQPVRDRDDAVARGIVLIPQGNALLRILSAIENVAVPLVSNGGRRRRERQPSDVDAAAVREPSDAGREPVRDRAEAALSFRDRAEAALSVRDRAEAALGLVGLAEAADQLLEELSGGQQQRVAVARGLAQRGRFLLADEPTSELDAANRARVMALLRAEAARGAGVLVATHDPEAAAACDAELHLSDGALTVLRDDRVGIGLAGSRSELD
jgi:putative ABC transport system ATP-binding protein